MGGSGVWSDMLPVLPEVDFIDRIGKGSFGEVYKGIWNDSVVGIKVICVKVRRSSDDNADEAQVNIELAKHEYESWLNANLRHPSIVQLFTSFTIGLESAGGGSLGSITPPAGASARNLDVPEFSSAAAASSSAAAHGSNTVVDSVLTADVAVVSSVGTAEGGGAAGSSTQPPSGLHAPAASRQHKMSTNWKTHLVMEYCDMGTMQVGTLLHHRCQSVEQLCALLA